MKKIITAICLILFSLTSITYANNWHFNGQSKNGNQYYIDLDEMSYDHSSGYQNTNIVTVHEKTILSPQEIAHYQEITRNKGNYHPGWDHLTHIITHYKYDLSNNTYAISYMVFLNQNDNVIAEYQQNPLRFKPVPINSFDEKTHKLILNNKEQVQN